MGWSSTLSHILSPIKHDMDNKSNKIGKIVDGVLVTSFLMKLWPHIVVRLELGFENSLQQKATAWRRETGFQWLNINEFKRIDLRLTRIAHSHQFNL